MYVDDNSQLYYKKLLFIIVPVSCHHTVYVDDISQLYYKKLLFIIVPVSCHHTVYVDDNILLKEDLVYYSTCLLSSHGVFRR